MVLPGQQWWDTQRRAAVALQAAVCADLPRPACCSRAQAPAPCASHQPSENSTPPALARAGLYRLASPAEASGSAAACPSTSHQLPTNSHRCPPSHTLLCPGLPRLPRHLEALPLLLLTPPTWRTSWERSRDCLPRSCAALQAAARQVL